MKEKQQKLKVFINHILSAVFILFLTGSLYSDESLPGSQSIDYAQGIREISMGSAGAASMEGVSGAPLNPAKNAEIRRNSYSVNLSGAIPHNFTGNFSFAMPKNFGVIYGNLIYQNAGAMPNALNHYVGVDAGLSKQLSETMYWGAGAKFGIGVVGSATDTNLFPSALSNSSGTMTAIDWNLGLSSGFILKPDIENSPKNGVGFIDPKFAFVLRNIGKPILGLGVSNHAFPAFGTTMGVDFYPVKIDNYQFNMAVDANFDFFPFTPSLNLGMEHSIMNLVKIRGGLLIDSGNFNSTNYVGPWSAGIALNGKFARKKGGGIDFQFGKKEEDSATTVELSYGIRPQTYHNRSRFAHYLNITSGLGAYDDIKPTLNITPQTNYFSANFDGVQDEVLFNVNMDDDTMISGWRFEIIDSNGQVIKNFKSVNRLKVRSLDFDKIKEQILAVKKQVDIPSTIEWNGYNEDGKMMDDGWYGYRLIAWDDNDNTETNEKYEYLYLDNTVPGLAAEADQDIFSPNGDGNKDMITFNIQSSNIQDGDNIKIMVVDDNQKAEKTYEYTGEVPEMIEWDGKGDDDNLLDEGHYSVLLTAVDAAGNGDSYQTEPFHLITHYETAEINPDKNETDIPVFSPNQDGIKDTFGLSPELSAEEGLTNWILELKDENGQTVRLYQGSNSLPDQMMWNGKNNSDQILPDGIYSYSMEAWFNSGNNPESRTKSVRIDNTPPSIEVSPQYTTFSPNDDGKQDTLTFTQDVSGENDDLFEIKIISEFGDVVFFEKSKLNNVGNELVWQGKDSELKPLAEGSYRYVIEGVDPVGNKTSKTIDNITLKTGLEKVSVDADLNAISPNGDGENDSVTLTAVADQETIPDVINYELTIQNEAGEKVKTYQSASFIESVVWKGENDNNEAVPDGFYTYLLKIKYSFGDEPQSAPRKVLIDTEAPEINLDSDIVIFSPNEDGRKETVTFKTIVKGTDNDVFTAEIQDVEGQTIRRFEWNTAEVPEELVWNGQNENGEAVPEGLYQYTVQSTDRAMNSAKEILKPVKLVREFEEMEFDITADEFSPNNDGTDDSITFENSVSSTEDLDDYVLEIKNSSGETVRTFKGKEYATQPVEWDGTSESGEKLPDGIYKAEVAVNYRNGNIIQDSVTNIRLDANPPEIEWNVSPDVFTPDNDGENDKLVMNLDIQDFSEVDKWNIDIYKVNSDGSRGKLFKSFSGEGEVQELIEWDGYNDGEGDERDIVGAVEDYVAVLSTADSLGNRIEGIEKAIPVGVLVEKTPEGLKIRVSSIQFASGSHILEESSKDTLDKVIYIIRKILSDKEKYQITEDYRIEISGHSDDVPLNPYGNAKKKYGSNKGLSEARAKSVYDYLIKNDIDKSILAYKGEGATKPYKEVSEELKENAEDDEEAKEKLDEFRGKNRRVEFFIRK